MRVDGCAGLTGHTSPQIMGLDEIQVERAPSHILLCVVWFNNRVWEW